MAPAGALPAGGRRRPVPVVSPVPRQAITPAVAMPERPVINLVKDEAPSSASPGARVQHFSQCSPRPSLAAHSCRAGCS